MDQNVINFLKRKGITVLVDEDITSKIELWQEWYKGNVKNFHQYEIYQGKRKLKRQRKTLNMPLHVCRRWANLLLNEKVEINIEDPYTNEIAHTLLEQINFKVKGNNLIEAAFAYGGGFFVQYNDGKKTSQKYITQDHYYPISYDTGRIIEAAFASNKTIAGKKYIYIEVHTKDHNDEYVIDNFLLQSKGNSFVEVSTEFYEQYNLAQKVETHSKEPLFQFIRPNINNRDKFDSPYGVSIFDGVTDQFESCDIIYDSYVKEFLLGRKRIFVKDGVTSLNYVQTSEGMESVRAFDPNDEVFYSLPDDEQTPQITEVNMELRISEHDAGIQTQLNLISQACGFGTSGFKWNSGNVTTATQVISENSEMYRTIKKNELILSSVISQMVKGLLFLEAMYTGNRLIKYDLDVTVNFDDSIIEDTAEIKRQALIEYNAGLIDSIQYYIDVYKMTEEQAINFLEHMKERTPPPDVEEEPVGA